MIFSQVCINFGPELQEGGWVGGRREGVGRGGSWGGTWQKLPDEDTGPPVAPDGGRIPGWLHPIANVSVMVLQGCKSTPQKSRPIKSGHGRHAVQVANVAISWGKKMNFNFCAN